MDIWSTTDNADTDALVHSVIGPTTHHEIDTHQPESGDFQRKIHDEVFVYKRRWYILTLLSLVGFIQGAVWNTWGPIASSTELVFGWTDATISLMENWGPITFILATPLFTWLMDVKGLRISVIITILLTTVGSALRCITTKNPAVTYLNHMGQMLNGIGGPVGMGAGPLLSATWFPAQQRTTATAVATIMNAFGVAVAFILGPVLVPDVKHSDHNSTTNHTAHDVHNIKAAVLRLMYYEFALSLLIFILIVIYFPDKPPKPPSVTASIHRLDYKEGVKALFKHPKFWMLGIPYAVPAGVYSAWSTVLDVNLKSRGVTEDEAGWMGFYATLGGMASGMIVSIFADIFKRRMKLFVIGLYSIAAGAFVVYTLVYIKIIAFSLPILYASVITGGMALSGAIPLFYELTCESTYPIAEGVTNGFLTWLNNIPALFFYFILMINSLDKVWTNWCLLSAIGVSIPILLAFREQYSRLDIDTQKKTCSDSPGIINESQDFSQNTEENVSTNAYS